MACPFMWMGSIMMTSYTESMELHKEISVIGRHVNSGFTTVSKGIAVTMYEMSTKSWSQLNFF